MHAHDTLPCTQALLNSSHAYEDAKHHMKTMGVTFDGLSFDWGVMQKAKDDTVSGLTKGIEGLFKKNKVRTRIRPQQLPLAASREAGSRQRRGPAQPV